MSEKPTKPILGLGLDCGTMNIVSARRTAKGVETRRMRDAFLDLDPGAKKMLKMGNVNYVERGGELLVLGDAAMEMANVFGREPRRPLSGGLLAAGEVDALEVLALIMKHVLGEPLEKGEACCFSVPAAPVDAPDRDIVYHRGVLERIVTECGYNAIPSNEAMAVIFAETAKDGFSGLGMSFGCLTPDTKVFARKKRSQGNQYTTYARICDVVEGDFVLSKDGGFNRVCKTWVRPHEGTVYHIEFFGNPFGVTLTGNHQVWVQRGGTHTWGWVRTEDLQEGDVVGEPVVQYDGCGPVMCFTETITNGDPVKKQISWSMGLGRLLGYFLADGHLGPDDRGTIWFDFGPNEQTYVDDVTALLDHFFKRSAYVTRHGNALRMQTGHTGLRSWLDRHCYGPEYLCEKTHKLKRDKVFPLRLEELNSSIAEGIIVGLFRGDGYKTGGGYAFSNTSDSLIAACHLLLARMGVTSTMNSRPARDSTFSDGREIHAENCKDEGTVHVTGADGEWLASLIEGDNAFKRADKVWQEGGWRCTRIRKITERAYNGPVHDLTVEGDPSFCAPYITLHNSGMSNIALAINTIEGMSFSVARGGDSIDAGAARAVGSTQARICAMKEKGIDLLHPKSREEEALALYYKNLVEHVLDQVSARFQQVKGQFALPKAVPIVISGGTSLAGGFKEFFEQVFEKKRKRFPIEISEIRQAKDPLNAVAQGLLLQAMQEHDA